MATFTNRVTTITQNKIIPKIVDGFLDDNFIAFRILAQAKRWSGVTLDYPIKYAKNTQGGSFSGMDTHGQNAVETRVNLSYAPKAYEIPVAIPGLERAVNGISETQVLNLVKAEMESTTQDGLDDVADLFYGAGTGNGGKDFEGFDNLNDDGTTAASVGGLTRATYPKPLNSTRTSFAGTLTLAKLATLVSAVSGGSAQTQKPDYFTSTETEQNSYEQLLTPAMQQNYTLNGLPMVTRTSKRPISPANFTGASGYTAHIYRGIPWVADEKGITGTVWLTNERYIEFRGVKDPKLQQITFGKTTVEGTYTDAPSGNMGFQWTGFRDSLNQYGEVGHIYLIGNMTSSQPRRLGRATSVTGV